MKNLLFIGVILISFSTIFALPGDLDPTFGVAGGYVVSDFGAAQLDERPRDTALQADGRVVVAGRRDHGVSGFSEFLVARYNADGALDTSFSGDGYFTYFDGLGLDTANALAIQPDGRIVVVGGIGDSNSTATVLRLNTDGTLDPTFSGDGIQTVVSSGNALAVALQTDGRIVFSTVYNGGAFPTGFQTVLVRLNTDGTLDTSFDGDGRRLVSDVTNSTVYQARGLAIQTDGKFLLAGQSSTNLIHNFTVVRLNTDGTPDTSFDGDGVARYNTRPGAAQSVLIEPGGKIVAGGGVEVTTGNDATLIRFNTDGTLDTSFDGDGLRTVELVSNNEDYLFNEVVRQPDGKFVAVADWDNVYPDYVRDDFYMLRFNADGSTDNSFDANGLVKSPWCEDGGDLALQTDGRIVTLGAQDRAVDNISNRGLCVQRYNADGAVDYSFNPSAPNGRLILSAGGLTEISAVAGLPNGKMIVAGWSDYGSLTEGVVLRLNANGTLDTTFMSEGVYLKNNIPSANPTRFYDVKVNGDGSFFVAGGSDSLGGVIVKFTAAGTLDTAFSGDGIASTGNATRFYAVAVQTDGKIVGCGSFGTTTRSGRVSRFSAIGTPETTVVNNLGAVGTDNEILECGLQSDGRLVVAGFGHDSPNNSDYVSVSRHLTTLAIDTGFGTSGVVTNDLSATVDDRATDLVIQSDNKIVVGSTGLNGGGDRDFAVLRYDANGALDQNLVDNFGTGGISLINFGLANPDDEAAALLLQSDGQMIVGGLSNPGTGERFALTKINAGGAPALTFGTLGRVLTPFPNNDARINALGFYLNDRIIAAGRAWNGVDYDFAIARYQNEFLPTAAGVAVAGRVLNARGGGIANAVVTLTGTDGRILTARSNSFGFYRFEGLAAGQTYVISVLSKRFSFGEPSRVLTVKDALTDVDFVAQE